MKREADVFLPAGIMGKPDIARFQDLADPCCLLQSPGLFVRMASTNETATSSWPASHSHILNRTVFRTSSQPSLVFILALKNKKMLPHFLFIKSIYFPESLWRKKKKCFSETEVGCISTDLILWDISKDRLMALQGILKVWCSEPQVCIAIFAHTVTTGFLFCFLG